MAESGEQNMPRDGKIVKELLRSMNIDSYEPQVIKQFLEFWYHYVADVLADAKTYSEHADKSVIDSDDIKLAIQSKVNSSFTQPPAREMLMELARTRNKIPLPKSLSAPGISLPPEKDTLIGPNYQLVLPEKQAEETEEDEDTDGTNHSHNPSLDQINPPQDPPHQVSFALVTKDPKC